MYFPLGCQIQLFKYFTGIHKLLFAAPLETKQFLRPLYF